MENTESPCEQGEWQFQKVNHVTLFVTCSFLPPSQSDLERGEPIQVPSCTTGAPDGGARNFLTLRPQLGLWFNQTERGVSHIASPRRASLNLFDISLLFLPPPPFFGYLRY